MIIWFKRLTNQCVNARFCTEIFNQQNICKDLKELQIKSVRITTYEQQILLQTKSTVFMLYS